MKLAILPMVVTLSSHAAAESPTAICVEKILKGANRSSGQATQGKSSPRALLQSLKALS